MINFIREMKRFILFISSLILLTSCIQDDPLNQEADILIFSFPQEDLRVAATIYNDYVVVYPKRGVDLKNKSFSIEVTKGADWTQLAKSNPNDTLFYIKVQSENKQYSKTYSIVQITDIPAIFDFENWVRPNSYYQYETPAVGTLQWYSSNNGAAIAWNKPDKPASDYLIRRILYAGSTAAELRTMEGPGMVAGNKYIPCLAGSLFLGDFDVFMGLSNPLRSTKFGIPFNSGKPTKFSGYYSYTEGTDDFIKADGTKDPSRRDTCNIYATLYKIDANNQYLYGDNVTDSPNIIARAQINPDDINRTGAFTEFELDFDYDSFSMPFSYDELYNNQYKLAIVFASSRRGAYYEGRPGSCLIIDDIKVQYE